VTQLQQKVAQNNSDKDSIIKNLDQVIAQTKIDNDTKEKMRLAEQKQADTQIKQLRDEVKQFKNESEFTNGLMATNAKEKEKIHNEQIQKLMDELKALREECARLQAKTEQTEELQLDSPLNDQETVPMDDLTKIESLKSTTTSTTDQSPSDSIPFGSDRKRAEALWDYERSADDPGQLSFKAGDIITLLEEDNDWCYGELNGEVGYVPSNYLKVLVKEIKVNQSTISPRISHLQQFLIQGTNGSPFNTSQ